ncbi:MAG: phosphatase PAP2 family protein [Elusimicrobia bacterium]|nr:phosphatase PAP2 family protein [Elusimicrobiota bacterium]
MRNKLFLMFFIVAFCGTNLLAKEGYNFFTDSRDVMVSLVNRPKEWGASDWRKLAYIGAGTALFMSFDEKIRDAFQKDNGKHDKSIVVVGGRIWGDYYPTAVAVGALGLYGWTLTPDKSFTKRITVEIVQATLYSEAITFTLKTIIGRARPFVNGSASNYRPFSIFKYNYNSFPGGHSTAAFAVSSVLASNTHSYLLKIAAYTPAVCTVISRVYENKHWASDCFFGAAIGYSVGTWLVNYDNENWPRVQLSSTLQPTIQMKF